MTANSQGSATVIAQADGSKCTENSVVFSIIAPTAEYYRFNNVIKHTKGYADLGFQSHVYLAPDAVSFENVFAREAQANNTANGVYECMNNQPHESTTSPPPVGQGSPTVATDGTVTNITDSSYSGGCPDIANQYEGGTMSVSIPVQYALNSAGPWQTANTVVASSSATTAGNLSRSKSQSSATSTVSAASTSY